MIFIPRAYEISEDHVTLIRWRLYKNHSKPHAMPRYAGSYYCYQRWIQHILGVVWMFFGIGGKK